MRIVILLAFFALCLTCRALDITTTDGANYKQCEVTKVEADTLVFTHRDGTARVSYDKLPKDIQSRYFDQNKVLAYRQQMEAEKKMAEAAALAERQSREKAALRAEMKARAESEEKRERDEAAKEEAHQAEEAGKIRETVASAAPVVGLVIILVLIVYLNVRSAGIMILTGALILVYFLFAYDTSVSVDLPATGYSSYSLSRVQNLGLMQNRYLGCGFGMFLIFIGVVRATLKRREP